MTRIPGLGGVPRQYADLAAVVVYVAGFALLAAVPGVGGTPLPLLLGLPFVLVAPGYAAVAVLYPVAASPTDADDADDADHGARSTVTFVERAVLSVATSVVIVATVSLIAAVSPWGLGPESVGAGTAVATLAAVGLAARRRQTASGPSPVPNWTRPSVSDALRPRLSVRYALNVALALGVVATVAAAGYAPAPADSGTGEQFTEFALLAENDTGALVTDGYPTTFERGEARPIHVRIDNHEGESAQYTLVYLLESVDATGETPTVTRSTELDRLGVGVDAGESRTLEHAVRPTRAGDLRLTVLLYRGDAPAAPSRSSAYRVTHLWISVERADTE